MDYITKIDTILICNNFRPNGITSTLDVTFTAATIRDTLSFVGGSREQLWLIHEMERSLNLDFPSKIEGASNSTKKYGSLLNEM